MIKRVPFYIALIISNSYCLIITPGSVTNSQSKQVCIFYIFEGGYHITSSPSVFSFLFRRQNASQAQQTDHPVLHKLHLLDVSCVCGVPEFYTILHMRPYIKLVHVCEEAWSSRYEGASYAVYFACCLVTRCVYLSVKFHIFLDYDPDIFSLGFPFHHQTVDVVLWEELSCG